MHVFETPGSVSLQVKLPSGRVLVTTADEPVTKVEVVAVGRRGQDAIDEIEVTMEERLGRHVVKIEQKDRFRWGPIQITWGGDFECRISCPVGSDLELSGGSTDIRASGELGEVSVRTASGDIKLETVLRELEVKTASGDIDVISVAANAVARDGVGRRDARTRGCVADRAIGLRRRHCRSHRRRAGSLDHVRRRRRQGRVGRRRPRPDRVRRRSTRRSRAEREPGSTRPRSPDDSSRSSDSRIRSPTSTTGAAARSSRCTSRPSAVTSRSCGAAAAYSA